jgi:hypothetical protein
MASLQQMRAMFDAWRARLILIRMPGLEKRLLRYPQIYSRIGSYLSSGPSAHQRSADCLRGAGRRPVLTFPGKLDPETLL